MSLKKKKSEQIHASKRFMERGRINFSKRTNELFCKCIQNSTNAKYVGKTSNRAVVWDITYEGKIYRCVYDKTRKQIVTLLFTKELPPEKIVLIEKPKTNPPIDNSKKIFKYGIYWASEKKLKAHEKRIKNLYEKDYEKWS